VYVVVFFCSEKNEDKEDVATSEVLEEQAVRHLGREYIDFLGSVHLWFSLLWFNVILCSGDIDVINSLIISYIM